MFIHRVKNFKSSYQGFMYRQFWGYRITKETLEKNKWLKNSLNKWDIMLESLISVSFSRHTDVDEEEIRVLQNIFRENLLGVVFHGKPDYSIITAVCREGWKDNV